MQNDERERGSREREQRDTERHREKATRNSCVSPALNLPKLGHKGCEWGLLWKTQASHSLMATSGETLKEDHLAQPSQSPIPLRDNNKLIDIVLFG